MYVHSPSGSSGNRGRPNSTQRSRVLVDTPSRQAAAFFDAQHRVSSTGTGAPAAPGNGITSADKVDRPALGTLAVVVGSDADPCGPMFGADNLSVMPMRWFTVRFPERAYEQIQKAAANHGISGAQYIREAAIGRVWFERGLRHEPLPQIVQHLAHRAVQERRPIEELVDELLDR